MKDGKVKEGSIKFLYSYEDINLDELKTLEYFKDWNFDKKDEKKQLMLTHRLIANQNNFNKIYNIYDNNFINDLKNIISVENCKEDYTLEEVIKINNLEIELENIIAKNINLFSNSYEILKDKSYKEIDNINIKKEQLIAIPNKNSYTESKRNILIRHLMKIQELIKDYENKKYNEVIIKNSFNLNTLKDKKILKNKLDYIKNANTKTIGEIIEFTEKQCLLKEDDTEKQDDTLKEFLDKNWYLYELVKNVPFSEIINLYEYLEGFVPFSTQHKIKGQEFNNVLIILDEGNWNNYNFATLFNENLYKTKTIVNRTQKLFYVCCTRAKENLVIYMNIAKNKKTSSDNILENAIKLFGEKNCHEINI